MGGKALDTTPELAIPAKPGMRRAVMAATVGNAVVFRRARRST